MISFKICILSGGDYQANFIELDVAYDYITSYGGKTTINVKSDYVWLMDSLKNLLAFK